MKSCLEEESYHLSSGKEYFSIANECENMPKMMKIFSDPQNSELAETWYQGYSVVLLFKAIAKKNAQDRPLNSLQDVILHSLQWSNEKQEHT